MIELTQQINQQIIQSQRKEGQGFENAQNLRFKASQTLSRYEKELKLSSRKFI